MAEKQEEAVQQEIKTEPEEVTPKDLERASLQIANGERIVHVGDKQYVIAALNPTVRMKADAAYADAMFQAIKTKYRSEADWLALLIETGSVDQADIDRRDLLRDEASRLHVKLQSTNAPAVKDEILEKNIELQEIHKRITSKIPATTAEHYAQSRRMEYLAMALCREGDLPVWQSIDEFRADTDEYRKAELMLAVSLAEMGFDESFFDALQGDLTGKSDTESQEA